MSNDDGSTPPPQETPPSPEEGYTIFAESFARWSRKPPVAGLRNLMKDEYPDETQLERDMLALQFLQFEVMRWVLQDGLDGDKEGKEPKEPWEK